METSFFEEIVLAEVADAVVSWPDLRDCEEVRAQEAFTLVATWNRVRRFPATDNQFAKDLDRIVRSEIKDIYRDVLAVCEMFSAEAWMADAIRLNNAYSGQMCDEEVEVRIRDCFGNLDEFCLATDALLALVPIVWPGLFVSEEEIRRIHAVNREAAKAQKLLADGLDDCEFLAAGLMAMEEWKERREDLLTYDTHLWRASLHLRTVGEFRLVLDADGNSGNYDQFKRPAQCFPGEESKMREAYDAATAGSSASGEDNK